VSAAALLPAADKFKRAFAEFNRHGRCRRHGNGHANGESVSRSWDARPTLRLVGRGGATVMAQMTAALGE
jgi:hypothetical protein